MASTASLNNCGNSWASRTDDGGILPISDLSIISTEKSALRGIASNPSIANCPSINPARRNESTLANSPPISSYWSLPSFNLATSDPSKKALGLNNPATALIPVYLAISLFNNLLVL